MSETHSIWFAAPAFAAALAALSLGAVCLAHNRAGAFNRFYRSLAMVLGASGVMQIGNGLGLVDPSHGMIWRRLGLLGELAQPAALAYVVRALMESTTTGGNEAVALWRARAITFLALVFGLMNSADLLTDLSRENTQFEWMVMGPLGRACYVFLLLSLAVGLAQLEQILRALRDPARYQLKFVLIGLGALAGFEIYQASQLLLVPVWHAEQALVGGLALLVAVGLIAYGLGRCRLQEIRSKVYVSQQVLYGSLTFIVIGVYLLGVGLIGEVVRYGGHTLGLVLSTGIVFLATVGLVVALCSRTVRAELQRFIARHFFRSKYDYRAKWLEVTEAFRGCVLVDAILDRVIELMSRTFGAGRISVWMRYETDGCFHQVRSINVETAPPLDAGHPVLKRLLATDEPLALEPPAGAAAADPFLEATRAVLCAPIQSIDGLIAFVTLSPERHEDRYGTDDCDLLRAIAHHVAVLLSQARLAEERRAAAELEALHRFSAFYVHDLKNLAAGLSLVVKNAEVHGQNPEFQRSAMRTIAMSVKKMMALMGKLSPQSAGSGQPESVDVHQAIAETIGSLNGGLRAPVRQEGDHVPPILIRRDQFQQVLLNVILNAQHALDGKGEIVIATERISRAVGITIADTGCGIGPERLRTLFQPFQTTKPGGLGIGLYQCKRIVESHGGSISINSRAGQGTRVHIQLPAAEAVGAAKPAAVPPREDRRAI